MRGKETRIPYGFSHDGLGAAPVQQEAIPVMTYVKRFGVLDLRKGSMSVCNTQPNGSKGPFVPGELSHPLHSPKTPALRQ